MKLRNGMDIPDIGFGTFRIKSKEAILSALKNGYRLIDTAKVYENEEVVKAALKESSLNRSEYFVTSKVWTTEFIDVKAECRRVLTALGLDYLDLYLLHWPRSYSENAHAWAQMEELYEEGLVKSIGVSNFQIHHLNELEKTARIFPMLNQIECHLNLPQYNMQAYLSAHQSLLQSYCSLMEGECLEKEQIVEVAKKYHVSPFQICLAWLANRNILIVPRSESDEHQKENLISAEIQLDDEDLALLKTVNKAKRYYPDPDNHKF